MADGRSMSNRRITAALVSWVVYGLAFISIHRLMGPSVATLNIVPVVATGWLLGMWAGLISSLVVFPVSLLLLLLGGEISRNAMTQGGGLTGSILLVLIGTAVGLLHDKVEQVKKELAKRAWAEEALRKSEATLHLQIERMPIGCIMWNPDFLVVSWNPAAARIFGFTEE